MPTTVAFVGWMPGKTGSVEDFFAESRSELQGYLFLLRFSKGLESGQRNIFIKSTHQLCNVLVICYFPLENLENIGLTSFLNTVSL